ncbi:hypothetical protein Baya_5242 [Bagarius yarrelli]|uniref:Uncharacterized protein n=1 Tax=Bagarius yarrelli TaxID=175774 RepID=A0A556TU47_BAGYA|nr:hypothetical protein Baya_5242 [Bagarius yarrelli]
MKHGIYSVTHSQRRRGGGGGGGGGEPNQARERERDGMFVEEKRHQTAQRSSGHDHQDGVIESRSSCLVFISTTDEDRPDDIISKRTLLTSSLTPVNLFFLPTSHLSHHRNGA